MGDSQSAKIPSDPPSTGIPDSIDVSEEQPPIPAEYESIDEKALMRRVDLRIIPVLSILYLMAFLDRVNISNALTLGLPKELGLVGNDINSAVAIFFVPYILFEVPSNIFLKRFKPHTWLPGSMFLFGLVMLCQGFVHNWSGLMATRCFLGLAETGVFPGCFYLMSMWYKREEAQIRFALFCGSATLAGAAGSLLASAIQNMNGVHGKSGWRWIFILEGLVTMLLSIAAYFVILDFPADSRWLTEEERLFITSRLRDSRMQNETAHPAESQFRRVLAFFANFRSICGGIMYFGALIPAYGLAYFIPTIVKGFGYSAIETQLHSVPPYAVAWVMSLLFAIVSDKIRLRSLPLAMALVLALIGSAILLGVQRDTPLQYGALFILVAGVYAASPIIICWYTMNLYGSWERGVGTAWQIAFGNIGGIVATFAFTAADAPLYHKGFSIIMVGVCITIAASLVYFCILLRERRLHMEPAVRPDDLDLERPEMMQDRRWQEGGLRSGKNCL